MGHCIRETGWKFEDFSVIHILREINFGDVRVAIFVNFGALNFVHLVNFILQKMQQSVKIQIHSLQMYENARFYTSSQVSMSDRKIMKFLHCMKIVCHKSM